MKSIYEFLLKSKTTASTQGNDYVDLDLPSGLLWARCNIGADEPYEYGDYFMWGSTEPNTNDKCDWKTCPFNDDKTIYNRYNGEYFNSIKDTVCHNGILAPEYDAATVILGGDWRLPTRHEFQELIDNTKQDFVKDYKGSSINGMLFTSNINGAELFIPASGYREYDSFYYKGTYEARAFLWSSSLFVRGLRCAWYIYFNDSSIDIYNRRTRCYGMCLRAVKE